MLKLTSSAPVFVGVEKGFFKDAGIEPELVFFQAAAPIATALAAGQLDVGATGLTAALYNIVLGGEQLWIVADKGREWPGYPLVAIVVQKELWDARAPVDRGSQGQAHRGDPARLDLPLPHRQYPREERAQARRRQDRAAPGHARHRRGIEGQAGRRHPRAPAVSRRHRGAGLRQDPRVGRRSLPVADRDDLLLEGLRRGSSQGRRLHEGLRPGQPLLLRRGARAEGRTRRSRVPTTRRSSRSPRSTPAPGRRSSGSGFPTRTGTAGCSSPTWSGR